MGRYRGQKSVPHSKFIFSIESGLNYDLPPGHDMLRTEGHEDVKDSFLSLDDCANLKRFFSTGKEHVLDKLLAITILLRGVIYCCI